MKYKLTRTLPLWRRAALGTIIFICTTLVALLFAELIVRVIYKDEIVVFPRFHTDAQYGEFKLRKIRPNTEFWHTSIDGSWKFVINRQGLRNNKDFPYIKPPGTFRVLSIGDSHTQGYEVRQEQTFSAVAERYLIKAGHKTEVINAGISGFGTEEQLLYLENEASSTNRTLLYLHFLPTI